MKKNNKKILKYGAVAIVTTSIFSVSTAFATTIEIKRNFSKSFNKNSQNVSLLDYVGYTNEASLSAQGGAASISYNNGVLSAGNSASIDPLQVKHSQAEISKKLRYYMVVSGDTVSSIAKKFGVSQATIAEENDIIKGRLKIKQELVILPVSGIKHTIKKGDTITALAKKYSADADKIREFNEISENGLQISQNLIIPGGKAEKKKVIAKKQVTSRSTGSSNATLVGDGSTSRYLNYKGIVPYGKGAKISVPKRGSGRSRYTKTNYGYFTHPAPGTVRTQNIHHRNAIDMGGPTGTNIYAAAAGKVIKSYSGGWGGGYGNHIIIEHSNGVQTMYAHNSKNLVWKGEKVAKGQQIADMGSTGKSTGPHLHFEVRGAYNPF